MAHPFISIIIPIYNSESYLRKCLDSVLAQTYADFEVLLIDDGSTDASGKICDEYAAKDARFKVFHKDNGGVSSARNLGLDHAQGEWITFVDSDDIVLKDYLKTLFLHSEDCIDMVVGAVEQLHDNQKRRNLVRSHDGIIKSNDFITLIEDLQIVNFGYVFSILYRKSIIVTNQLKFDVRLSQSEDMLFILDYILHLKKNIKCLSSAYYLYVMDIPNSGSKKKVSAKSINLQLTLMYKMISKKYKIVDFKKFPKLANLLDYLYYKKLSELVSQDVSLGEKVINLSNLDKKMIRFFQGIRQKSLRAKLLDFLLLHSYYNMFLKLRKL